MLWKRWNSCSSSPVGMIRALAPFESEEMERELVEEISNVAMSMCTTWCLGNAVFLAGGFSLHVLHCLATMQTLWEGGTLIVFAVVLVSLALLMATIFAVHCMPWLRPHMTQIICWLVVLLVVLTTLLIQSMVASNSAIAVHLPILAASIQGNDAANAEVLHHNVLELSKKYIMLHGMMLFFILHILQFVPYNKCILTMHVVVPIALIISFFLSPVMPTASRPIVFVSLGPFIFSLFNCANTMGLRRSNFRANYQLQAALAQEARALQKARDLEAAQKEASQKADSILNHILKNIMAEAAGLVELFLGGDRENNEVLHQATDCLYRGMRWCKQRQAILRIASGCYSPAIAPVSLHALGDSLIKGRRMTHRFLEGTFLLDSTLCGIVLDNAISNAFRHGHPDDPQVTFTMSVAVLPGEEDDDGRCRLTFEVTNRIAPSRPQMTRDLLHRILNGPQEPSCVPSSLLSDHFGLRHMFAAAELHGMELTLQQLEDCVVFEATLDVKMCGETSEATTPREDLDQVPFGLHIVCLDDSQVARKLLAHSLRTHIKGAVVAVYGASEDEVDSFVEAAICGADVVVLDQNVTFGTTTVLGTNVVHRLLGRGFVGCICIRSANSSVDDQALYFASGAHCVLGKDLPPSELAMQLQLGFLRYKLAHSKESYPTRSRLVIQSLKRDRGNSDLSSGLSTPTNAPVSPLQPRPRGRSLTLPGVPAAACSDHHNLLVMPGFCRTSATPVSPFA